MGFPKIRTYQLNMNFEKAANGEWAFAIDEATNEEIFLKEFSRYRYPSGSDLDPNADWVIAETALIDEYKQRMEEIDSRVREVAGVNGDVVVAISFFKEGVMLYKVNKKIEYLPWKAHEVKEHLSILDIDKMMRRLVNAMGALHNGGIVHNDLKPDNIFIVKSGEAYVGMISDFDDSFFKDSIPESGYIVGTPEYFSPEIGLYVSEELSPDHAIAQQIGITSDIFALGLIYHEYLSGELPIFSEENEQVWQALCNGERIKLSKKIDYKHRELIARMLAIEPSNRPRNCGEISRKIGEFIEASSRKLKIVLVNGDSPLKGKKVSLQIQEGNKKNNVASFTTKNDGSVEIAGLLPGKYFAIHESASKSFILSNEQNEVVKFDVAPKKVQPKNNARISVRVLSNNENYPECSVLIEKWNVGGYASLKTLVTDNTGMVLFDKLPKGKFRISALGSLQEIELSENSSSSIKLKIELKTQVIVKVTDKIEGIPVTGVVVQLRKEKERKEGKVTYIVLAKDVTDANGESDLGNHTTGDYNIKITSVPVGFRAEKSTRRVTLHSSQKSKLVELIIDHALNENFLNFTIPKRPGCIVKSVLQFNSEWAMITLANDKQKKVRVDELHMYLPPGVLKEFVTSKGSK